MKNIAITIIMVLLFYSCVKEETYNPSIYTCHLNVSSTPDHPMQFQLDRFMDRMIDKGSTGVSVMIKSPDGVCYGSKGMADIASGVEMQPCHKFRIGSVSKIITAATILRLYDEGKLDLNDPISKYLEKSLIDKIKNAENSSIKMLLNHSSGIINYLDFRYLLDALNFSFNKESVDFMLERVHGKDGADETTYSNTNYLLLGKIMENIEHKPVYEIIREKVISPLNLNMSFISDKDVRGLSQSYADVYNNGKFANVTDIDEKLFGNTGFCDGALISDAESLILFLESLSDTSFLKSTTFETMKSFENIPKDPNNKYTKKFGLGLFYYETPYGAAYGHPGGLYGSNSFLCFFPEKKMYFVCLSNSSQTGAFLASDEVFGNLFED